ncbi:MAG: PAS domain-containing protein, partial [Phycisphaerae bacterium]|nr:PAS domain-containing protein [Phycisphaerae bacterium]
VSGLIREALLALKAGESAGNSLGIAATLGPEAEAWNALLNQTQAIQVATIAEKTRVALSQPREGRNDLALACDSLTVGIILVDQSGVIRHANGAASTLLQIKRGALQGDFASHILDERVQKAVAAIRNGGGRSETIELQRGDTQAGGVLRVHIRPLRREDGNGAVVTIEDVTQQRVAEASRNAFIAQATHELRTPLTNMRLCLECAIEDDEQDPAALKASFNTLNRETRRLERMVSEMLSVAEIEAGSLQLSNDDVKLDRLFADLEIDYRPYANEKQIALAFELPPKLPDLFADRDRLAIALHNLIGNAIKYTPEGGRVSISMRADAGKLNIDVSDTGIGISEQELAPIFDRFYRAKDPRVAKITGSGLGLALAREIARLHGGDISVQSDLNKGSTFTLTVPLSAPHARAAA